MRALIDFFRRGIAFLDTVNLLRCIVGFLMNVLYDWPVQYLSIVWYKFMPPGNALLQEPPEQPPRTLIIIGLGWQQDQHAMLQLAKQLVKWVNARVMFMQNPGNVNDGPFQAVTDLNLAPCAKAIKEARTLGIPVIGIGFSKGGLDLVWLAHSLRTRHRMSFDHIWTFCAPFRGSRVAAHGRHPNVNLLHPHSAQLALLCQMVNDLQADTTVQFRFYASWLDPIVDASDARPPRPVEHQGRKIDPVMDRHHEWYARWIPGGIGHNVMNLRWVVRWIVHEVEVVIYTAK